MKNRYLTAIIAGTVVGAAAGMYSKNMMKSRRKRNLLRKSKRMLGL